MFFFFKQKTAYEMRISDWSSDVCSSDLPGGYHSVYLPEEAERSDLSKIGAVDYRTMSIDDIRMVIEHFAVAADRAKRAGLDGVELHGGHGYLISSFLSPKANRRTDDYGGRSAEHTSELQSLMRSSYAVFCLKKNN